MKFNLLIKALLLNVIFLFLSEAAMAVKIASNWKLIQYSQCQVIIEGGTSYHKQKGRWIIDLYSDDIHQGHVLNSVLFIGKTFFFKLNIPGYLIFNPRISPTLKRSQIIFDQFVQRVARLVDFINQVNAAQDPDTNPLNLRDYYTPSFRETHGITALIDRHMDSLTADDTDEESGTPLICSESASPGYFTRLFGRFRK